MYQHDEMRSDNRMLLILASTKMEHVKTDARSYTLYHNNWSVCSLMARLTLELAGRSNNSFPHVEQIPIDIPARRSTRRVLPLRCQPEGNGRSQYVLSGGGHFRELKTTAGPRPGWPRNLSENLTESLDITYHFRPCSEALWPAEKVDQMQNLLHELHEINYFALTYTHKPQRPIDMENAVLRRLEDREITPRHREALKYKLEM